MYKKEVITYSPDETLGLGVKLGSLLRPGNVITLEGELGAGKTTLTKGIAKGIGVDDNIKSPTFTIVKEYKGKYPFYHMDVYRLEDSDEDIGFLEYFHGDGITVVEWASFITDYLPDETLDIQIDYGEDESRVIKFTANSDYYKEIVDELTS